MATGTLSYPQYPNFIYNNVGGAVHTSSQTSKIENYTAGGSATGATMETNDWIKIKRVSDNEFTWYLQQPSVNPGTWIQQNTWHPGGNGNYRLMWSTFDLFNAAYYVEG